MFIGANRHLGANDRRKSQVQQRAGFDQGNDVIGPSPGTEWDGMQQSGTAGSTRRSESCHPLQAYVVGFLLQIGNFGLIHVESQSDPSQSRRLA